LKKLDTALPGSKSFAVGTKMSLADVSIFKLLKDTYDRDISETYSDCSKLLEITKKVGENEALQKWMEERPKSMF